MIHVYFFFNLVGSKCETSVFYILVLFTSLSAQQGLVERLRAIFDSKRELFVLRVWSCFVTILDKVSSSL